MRKYKLPMSGVPGAGRTLSGSPPGQPEPKGPAQAQVLSSTSDAQDKGAETEVTLSYRW